MEKVEVGDLVCVHENDWGIVVAMRKASPTTKVAFFMDGGVAMWYMDLNGRSWKRKAEEFKKEWFK
jgi:hypothetical protein